MSHPSLHKNMTREELLTISRSKFDSATILQESDKSEDAIYLAGYALEFMIKRHIALRLNWSEYPPKQIKPKGDAYSQDTNYTSFYTHDLQKLLCIGGLYQEIISDTDLKSHLDTTLKWKVEMRYETPGTLSAEVAAEIISSTLFMIKWIKAKYE